MTELDFLEKLNMLEHEIYIATIMLEIPSLSENERSNHLKKMESLSQEKKKIEQELESIDDKSHSIQAKKAMAQQISEYVFYINKADKGLKLSRNQGLIVENYLFFQILNDLDHFVRKEVFGIHVPMYLRYTYSGADALEISELSDFLRNELKIISDIKEVNYPVLKEYLKNLQGRMSIRFFN